MYLFFPKLSFNPENIKINRIIGHHFTLTREEYELFCSLFHSKLEEFTTNKSNIKMDNICLLQEFDEQIKEYQT